MDWIATANTLGTVDAPLLSRLTVVTLDAASEADARGIAALVNALILSTEAWGYLFPAELPDGLLERTEPLSPRAIRQALLAAYGRAARAGEPVAPRPTKTMGFVAQSP